jgi:ferritin-like metal-binding protein YciE
MEHMGNRQEALATYVGDMHALEKHLLEAFEKQVPLAENMPEAQAVTRQLVDSTRQRVSALEQQLASLGDSGKSITDAVKTAAAGLAGVAAGAIDWMRPQSVSKALRDSYTASNHAIISYIMLQTTGIALNDTATAALAERHLQDCVRNAQAIANIMPSLVVKDLSDDVGSVDASAATQVTGSQQLGFLFHR